jgi:hypothetical protein
MEHESTAASTQQMLQVYPNTTAASTQQMLQVYPNISLASQAPVPGEPT